ncbi:MAG TPA: SUMF1/EgtB/PvdO family nonheme iron enzyme [Acetobacteraceae bacterium]|nr:SUMF1/EgtB/PvdO family nonheme iron enzyme [Acetobacteraceae bacterium]
MGELDHTRETPLHTVKFASLFAIDVYPVTFDEWDAPPAVGGWGRGRRPVINVTWDDAKSHAMWLSRKAGKHYRLLSEAEWEKAAQPAYALFPVGRCDGAGRRRLRRLRQQL